MARSRRSSAYDSRRASLNSIDENVIFSPEYFGGDSEDAITPALAADDLLSSILKHGGSIDAQQQSAPVFERATTKRGFAFARRSSWQRRSRSRSRDDQSVDKNEPRSASIDVRSNKRLDDEPLRRAPRATLASLPSSSLPTSPVSVKERKASNRRSTLSTLTEVKPSPRADIPKKKHLFSILSRPKRPSISKNESLSLSSEQEASPVKESAPASPPRAEDSVHSNNFWKSMSMKPTKRVNSLRKKAAKNDLSKSLA
eukprot:TRINITY_DN8539_c0_g1_i2.p1 TRINITY_DN8539_c0_g1~~TRINITY_DN8539_c0_g1_i2.p1  ORF type:complete len:257 (+),score=14.26 TRINITY_DN8539_c0_g1_i2:69-839(+)